MGRPKKSPPELIERGIRLALESERPIAHIAHDLGIHPERLRKRLRQHEADSGKRPDLASGELRAAPGQRDFEVGVGLFAKELDPDRPK